MTAAGNQQCALGSIHAIFSLHQLWAVLGSISQAIIHVFIISIINKQIIELQSSIHRQTDDFVHVRFSNLIGIFCLNQCLFSIGQLHLRAQHVNLGYNANIILCLNIFQMVLQTGNGFRAELLDIICLQHIKITVGNGRTHFVIGALYANLIVLIVSLSLFNATAQFTTGKNWQRCSQCVRMRICNVLRRIIITATITIMVGTDADTAALAGSVVAGTCTVKLVLSNAYSRVGLESTQHSVVQV